MIYTWKYELFPQEQNRHHLDKMKKIIIIAVIFFICFAFSPKHLSAENDKIKHFGISILFGAAGESYLHYSTELKGNTRVLFGTALGTLPGLFKEIVDSTKNSNRFSGGDLIADILGSFCGAFLSNTINNKIQVNINLNNKKNIWIFSLSCSF